MSILIRMIYPRIGTGETSSALTSYLGASINTFQSTAAPVGHKVLPLQFPTESTSWEIILGLKWLLLRKCWSTAMPEAHATEETLSESTHSPRSMESRKKHASSMLQKIPLNILVLHSKIAWTASQVHLEKKMVETATPLPNSTTGLFHSTDRFLVLHEWKQKYMLVARYHAVSMQQINSRITLQESTVKNLFSPWSTTKLQ